MPRIVRDSRIETRTQRAKLAPRGEPYYRALESGLHLGYRRGQASGRWVVRRYAGDGYRVHTLPGIADDTQDADGVAIFSYSQAIAAARAAHARAVAPPPDGTPRPAGTVATAAARYIRYLRATKSRKQAKDTVRRLRRHLPKALRRRPVRDVSKTEIESWLWSLVRRDPNDPEIERRSQDTANRVLTMVKAALNRFFSDDANDIPTDRAWRVVKPFEDVGRSRTIALDADQRQRLLNTTTGAFRNLVIATLFTGSRPAPGEIARCRVRDFHQDLGTLSITDSKTVRRAVPLSDEAVRWFKSIAAGRAPDDLLLPKDDGTAWGENHQVRPMRQAAERAKLPKGANMYCLRHTYATEHIMRGTDLKSLADIMGTSIKMLEKHYGHILASHKRKIVEAAGFGLGLKVKSNVATMKRKKGRAA